MQHAPRDLQMLAAGLALVASSSVPVSCELFGLGQATMSTPDDGAGGDQDGAGAHDGTSVPGAGGAGAAPSTTGGAAPSYDCISPIECEGLSNECTERTCIDGECGQKPLKPAGAPSAFQTEGDCKTAVCGEDGTVQTITDEADTPDDHDDCTLDACLGYIPTFESAPIGAPCGAGGLLKCDGAGACHGCNTALDCEADGPCFDWSCTSGTCVKSPASDGTDCGECQKCYAGACGNAADGTLDPDCPNGGVCSGLGVCQCADQAQDGAESDVDCGGPSCPACPNGKACNDAGDCVSGHCVDGICCNDPCDATCAACAQSITTLPNGICGMVPAGQDPHQGCSSPEADTCNGSGACQCSDGVQNGDETAVDCGGSTCAPCPGVWQCAGDCTAPTCCPMCCAAGVCTCPDEQALCLELAGLPCLVPGQTITFSAPTPGPDPSCVDETDNPDGLGCAATVCTCQ
jgi:hypothetical protein